MRLTRSQTVFTYGVPREDLTVTGCTRAIETSTDGVMACFDSGKIPYRPRIADPHGGARRRRNLLWFMAVLPRNRAGQKCDRQRISTAMATACLECAGNLAAAQNVPVPIARGCQRNRIRMDEKDALLPSLAALTLQGRRMHSAGADGLVAA